MRTSQVLFCIELRTFSLFRDVRSIIYVFRITLNGNLKMLFIWSNDEQRVLQKNIYIIYCKRRAYNERTGLMYSYGS